MTKLTDDEVATKLLGIRLRLRGISYLLEYHRPTETPHDLDDCMSGVGEILNGFVEELDELRNLFDPSRDDDREFSIKNKIHRRL